VLGWPEMGGQDQDGRPHTAAAKQATLAMKMHALWLFPRPRVGSKTERTSLPLSTRFLDVADGLAVADQGHGRVAACRMHGFLRSLLAVVSADDHALQCPHTFSHTHTPTPHIHRPKGQTNRAMPNWWNLPFREFVVKEVTRPGFREFAVGAV